MDTHDSVVGRPVHGLLWVAMGIAGAAAMAAQASFELSALAAGQGVVAAARPLPPDPIAGHNNKGDEAVMHTRRSFLAFAAAAQAIGPLARAMPVQNARPLVARLPEVLVKTHEGRDVYFCNDKVSGRLAVLNLQYADSPILRLPPGAGMHQPYLYSLTLQPAIGSPADLRRYMEAYAKGGAWPSIDGVPEEFELVRLRLGMYSGT